MPAKDWGIYLCDCQASEGLEPALFEDQAHVVMQAAGGKKARDLKAFAGAVDKADLERVLIACSEDEGPFLEKLSPHVGTAYIHFTDLKNRCFLPHGGGEPAREKARRLVRATIGSAELSARFNENLMRVEGKILIETDHPAGMELEKRLKDLEEVIVVVRKFGSNFKGKSYSRLNRGAITAIEGRLGAFAVTVKPHHDPDERPKKPVTYQVSQVVVFSDVLPESVKAKTGIHLAESPESVTLDRIESELRNLTGMFRKPEMFAYNASQCAGGAAGQETCGHCIASCPYDALSRDDQNHLRIRADHFACEGCAACSAVCPTSAIQFHDPSPRQIFSQVAALTAGNGGKKRKTPQVVVFHCGERGAEVMEAGLPHSEQALPVAVPCTRYINEAHLLKAVAMGADGVALMGCESCPNGERDMLIEKMELAGTILKAFDLEPERFRLITSSSGENQEAIEALNTFMGSLKPTTIPDSQQAPRMVGNRDLLAQAIAGLIEATGKEPGGLRVGATHPYGFAEIDEGSCTLCRSCVNVCPTHAFRMDLENQTLEYKPIMCINCGLCQSFCPEKVVTIHPELYLEKEALDYMVVVEDEMVNCAKCEKPYINRRALESIESKVFSLDSLMDTFTGGRKNLLRMCPDCRAVDAMLEVNQGWEP